MAKASTTHVIEIESGIGEPAFIPLTMGKELEPISVGKKGMWRIESARVLDVHAFVYFDGTALFLQSADESGTTSVDGYKVGKAWTELTAPCQIEIGSARLRFRSLLAPEASAPPPPKHKTPPPPPIQTMPKSDMPLSFPKAERPFAPGALANAPQPSEDTRVKPFDATSGARRPDEDPRFARTAGMPAASFAPQASEPPPQHQHRQPTPTAPPMRRSTGPLPPPDPMLTGPMMPNGHQMMVTGPMMPPGSGGYGPHRGHAGQVTGPHVPMPYGYGQPMLQPMTGPPPGPAHAPDTRQGPGLLAKYKELSGPKKILVVLAPFCLLASGYLILFDEEPRPQAIVDAGVVVAPHPTVAATAPPTSNCPPGFVPWPTPINGTIPCVPAAAIPTATAPPTGPQPLPTPPLPTPPTIAPTSPPPRLAVDAGAPPVATSTKTLERQAVDAVALNDYARAAKIYEVLQQQNPTNRVYAEAARILRAKATAGVP